MPEGEIERYMLLSLGQTCEPCAEATRFYTYGAKEKCTYTSITENDNEVPHTEDGHIPAHN